MDSKVAGGSAVSHFCNEVGVTGESNEFEIVSLEE